MINTAEIRRQLEARGPGPCKRCEDWTDEPCPVCGGIAKRAVGLLAEALTEVDAHRGALTEIANAIDPVDGMTGGPAAVSTIIACIKSGMEALEHFSENQELKGSLDAAEQRAERAEAAAQVDNEQIVAAEQRAQAAEEDSRMLDWLSDNMAYLQMVNKQTNVMYTLPNKGKGWKDNELREAIRAAMGEEQKS